jgi:hypothetical protein
MGCRQYRPLGERRGHRTIGEEGHRALGDGIASSMGHHLNARGRWQVGGGGVPIALWIGRSISEINNVRIMDFDCLRRADFTWLIETTVDADLAAFTTLRAMMLSRALFDTKFKRGSL